MIAAQSLLNGKVSVTMQKMLKVMMHLNVDQKKEGWPKTTERDPRRHPRIQTHMLQLHLDRHPRAMAQHVWDCQAALPTLTSHLHPDQLHQGHHWALWVM